MLLSVIIVNYNVKYFLEQCLCSVQRAIDYQEGPAGTSLASQTEVLVVDNQSTDGSLDYLPPRFPFVQFIANSENGGFARANNQALAQCRGKYVLFLNPDTILPEEAFQQCLAFMETHPAAGALGVHMIDGSGQYLPESKRGFPSPWVSFCKMTGLTRLFPTSKWLARYYLGHLPPGEVHQVDVLSGAFFWARKEALDKTGGFDERFFMYAEDIDLSYRIQQAGYHNYYLPAPVILHFKGESTRRDARYIKLFYTAMIQFVEKHYKGTGAWWYVRLLKIVIRLKSLGAPNADPQPGNTTPATQKIALVGDAATMEKMKLLLMQQQHPVVLQHENAGTLIVCEGAAFTFSAVINKVRDNPTSQQLFIHGYNTSNAVGSSAKDKRGNYII